MDQQRKHRRLDPFAGGVSRREMLIGGSSVVAGVALATTGVASNEPAKTNAAAHTSAAGRRPSAQESGGARAMAADERASRSDARRRPPENEEPEEREEPRRKPSRATAAMPAAILTTGDWNARKPDRKATVRSGAPRYIVIHHTTTDNEDDFSESQAKWVAGAIQNAHMQQGWGDTGQQFTVSRGGYVLEGRHGAVDAVKAGDTLVGVHVAGMNDYAVGIECEGNYNDTLPPKELRASLVRLCAWLCKEYDLNPRKAIVPHRKFNATDCCGDEFAATIPQLRKAVAKAMDGKSKDERKARERSKLAEALEKAKERAKAQAKAQTKDKSGNKGPVSDGGRGLLEEFLSPGLR